MRTRWAVLLLTVVMVSAISAFAGSPTMGVLDPTCNASNNTNNGDVTYDFGITTPGSVILPNITSSPNGGGVFIFCNLTQSTWDTAEFATNNFGNFASAFWEFTAVENPFSAVTCSVGSGSSQGFLDCTVAITANEIDLKFFGEDKSKQINGIQNNHTMTVTLNTNFSLTGDQGDWLDTNGNPVTIAGGVNLTQPLSAPQVPEPASLILLGTGVAASLLRLRKKSRG